MLRSLARPRKAPNFKKNGHFCFVVLQVIEIQFLSEILPRLHLSLVHREGYGLSGLSVSRMQRIIGCVLKPCLLHCFLCLKVSLSTPWFHQEGTFLPLCATSSGSRQHARAAHKATAALKSCHSISAPAVHSGSSRNKDDVLFANLFFTSLSARASLFIR